MRLFIQYVLISIKVKPGFVNSHWKSSEMRKKGVKLSLQVSVLVSLHCVWVYVHVPLYKSSTLSVSMLQIVCLPLSPP